MFGISLAMLLFAILATLAGGGIATYLLARSGSEYRITAPEFIGCSVLLVAILLPSIGWIGGKIAQSSSVGGYIEFWNGSITAAKSSERTCERDGDCVREYDCDPYTELETYIDTETYIDANGKTQTRSVTKTRLVTKYHSCPYATKEYSYWLEDSLGDRHDIAMNVFAADPTPFRRDKGLPSNVSRGVPERWTTTRDNLAAGDADPVTKTMEYTNYLLASQDSLLKAYSDKVDEYREAGLLPLHTVDLLDSPVYDGYRADKVVFVGDSGTKTDRDEWQQALSRLNSYLGSELQGDLHVLVAPASAIDNPDDYTNALLAYWQSRELGKHGLAKNAIMLVVGVSDDASEVEWSRAKTGIPVGNGEMLAALSTQLDDMPFEARSLIGWPKARPDGDDLSFTPSEGRVEQIVTRDYPFKRPCMDCKDKGDEGDGFVYLKSSAYISTGAQLTVAFFLFLFGMGAFALVGFFDPLGAIVSSRRRKPSEYELY